MLADILLILVAAVIVVPLFQRLGLGSVLGYLFAGLLVGPSIFGFIGFVDKIRQFAELGVVFLLFVIGLGLKPERLWTMRATIFGLGLTQVLVSGAVISLLVWRLVGLGPRAAIVIGFGLALSSTAFVLQLLTERAELSTQHGHACFGILLLQDLAVVPLLMLIDIFAPRAGVVGVEIGLGMLEGLGALVLVILAGRYAVRPILRHISAAANHDVFTATAVLLALGAGWFMEYVGMSMALGAFLAGVLLSDSEFRHQITADIEHFRGLLLGLFFIGVGMSINLQLLGDQPLTILGIVLGLLAIKMGLLYPIARLFQLPSGDALRVALYLAQAGEFGFVLFALALNEALLTQVQFNILILAVATSMLLTPPLFILGHKLGTHMHSREIPPELRADHARPAEGMVFVAGFGRFGRQVCKILASRDIPYVAMDQEVVRVIRAHEEGFPVYFGDATRVDVLRHLGVAKARLAVITLDNPLSAERTIRTLRQEAPDVPIFARTRSGEESRQLYARGVEVTVPEALESSLQLAASVLHYLGTEDEEIYELVNSFREEDYRRLQESHHSRSRER